jgi:hypothetical protein
MEILKKVEKYYASNLVELEAYLENISFINTNSKYPNSVVLKFGENKIIGEISVWEFEEQKYIEVEYANLSKAEIEPVCYIKTINSETIIETLKNVFEKLRETNQL